MTDHLTSLPFELFDYIIRLAQSNPQTKPLYVSKVFLPFVRPRIFNRTTIRSYEDLSAFFAIINDNPAIPPFVHDLEIKLEGKQDVGVPKNKVLKTGFVRLVSTGWVKLEGSSRIAKLLLAPSNDSCLISMWTLRIRDPLNGFQNPLDPSHYRWLDRYKKLFSLRLQFDRDCNETGRRRGSSTNALDFTNRHITRLDLDAHCINNPSLLDFISFFTNLVSLDIFERTDDGTSRLLPILNSIAAPDRVTSLGLQSCATPDNPEDLSSILPRFRHLLSLDFGPGTLDNTVLDLLNHSTFPNLKALRLDYVNISYEQLKSLISGDKKLSNLRYLCVESTEPTTEEMVEIVELADREGMDLGGHAVSVARREIEARKKETSGRSYLNREMENLRI